MLGFNIEPKSIIMIQFRPLAGFDENCRCQWGLLRDRNVSLRNPISMLTGEDGMASRGRIASYNRRHGCQMAIARF